MAVKFTKARGGDCPDTVTCPAVYVSGRGTVAVTGREVTDPAERAQLGIGPGETAVEVSAALLPEVAS